ncbi:asparaginase domain-containing protein [Marinomonas algarum]|uniref:Asparaginase domain-containing protein n=1 Tax=Marinomonas algarum TaxID=2883105 RepID=A0A9X1IRM4_9GAMM|nr:asparaginase domain-containing protein [Marinomonas algarum]MCB5162923.1 asparaginase domain-containing protein [Marinomonas algarum]
MKIYIAYTGGTIGMVSSEHGLVPDAAFAEQLAGTLDQFKEYEHEFVVEGYDTLIDSSNASPKDWQKIARDVESKWAGFDAFIVLHGTDTMAYTAAALFYMIAPSNKPIIVTGSQVPMFHARSDALNNVLGSVSACEEQVKGVFLFFANRLIEGDRAHKSHTQDWQAFSSPNKSEFGLLGIDWIWRDSDFIPLLSNSPMTFRIPEMEEGAVTILPVFPGVQAEHWQGLLNNKVKGAVLLSYGAGNAPDKNPALLAILKQASDRGVVIVNVSQCGAGSVAAGAYATSVPLIKSGVVSGKDSTFEAAFVRLHVLIGLGLESGEIKEIFIR